MRHDWNGIGEWIRQDPGFPDALFKSSIIQPNPGIEIKAWFPFATEITARFKDSVTFPHALYGQFWHNLYQVYKQTARIEFLEAVQTTSPTSETISIVRLINSNGF